VVGAVRLSSDGDCVENSDCDINITRHAVMRHEFHMSKYLEAAIEELTETLRKCISEIFERSVAQPVSARLREVEKGRRNVFEAVFDGFRCRLRPPSVCILYKPGETPPPGLPLPGGTVYEGLFFTAAESRAYREGRVPLPEAL